MINIISAVARNGVIGNKGKIPWQIQADMEYFRKTTMGSVVIMGRKTFESISNPLPHRINIIVSRNLDSINDCICAKSLADAIKYAQNTGKEIFICGGAGIYREALNYTHRIYLTEIEKEFQGDTFFPDFDKNIFRLIKTEPYPQYGISFNIYEKKQNSTR